MENFIFLDIPRIDYKSSYLMGIRELIEEGYLKNKLDIDSITKNFEDYLHTIDDFAKGENIPEDFSPQSEYWLIKTPNTYLGTIKIKHELGNAYLQKSGGHIGYFIPKSQRGMGYGNRILQLGLEKARLLNLKKVLITCNESNIGSRRIIETNGGIFERLEFCKKNGVLRRYWVTLQEQS